MPKFLCLVSVLIFLPLSTYAEVNLSGNWVLNEKASDNTDKQVEKAIKASGGKVRRPKKTGKYFYKGGPEEQELYDHLSYDEFLTIQQSDVEFYFIYKSEEDDGRFSRTFYSDNRGRSVSANSFNSTKRVDFSFGSWEGNRLVVESRVRDGGRTTEIYSLHSNDTQLRVEIKAEPLSFLAPIELVRIYDRKQN